MGLTEIDAPQPQSESGLLTDVAAALERIHGPAPGTVPGPSRLTPATSPPRIARGMKVLIIDDDDDVRTIARLSLGRIGRLTVVEASDGVEGVEKAAAERPDVIVLDVMMPGMDGPATLEVLRARPDMRDMPVIFLTAKVLRSEVERLRRLGALAVFEKPFNPRTLADDLQRALGRQAS